MALKRRFCLPARPTQRGPPRQGGSPGNEGLLATRASRQRGPHGNEGGRPWRGTALALPKRAWQATLAGTADDPGGAQLWHSLNELGRPPCRPSKSLAGDPGGAGERPWRGWRATLAGTGVLVLAKGAWRATLRGRRRTLAGHSSGTPKTSLLGNGPIMPQKAGYASSSFSVKHELQPEWLSNDS